MRLGSLGSGLGLGGAVTREHNNGGVRSVCLRVWDGVCVCVIKP